MNREYRLNKFLTEADFCSRREADELISQGKVKVNGQVATIGMSVTELDKIYVGEQQVENNTQKVYLALNKPSGITCTTDKKDPTNIVDFVGYHERIFPIGRLDKDSEGLILLTNDGDIVNRILRAGNAHEKEYTVTVNRPVNQKFQGKMSSGVKIHNTITLPCKVQVLKPTTFSITLVQGLNRQIRLMCEALGYEVLHLKRTRIMNISIKGIGEGDYRKLTEAEVKSLLEATKNSVMTEEGSGRKKNKRQHQSKKNPSVRYAKNPKLTGGNKKIQKKKSPIRNKMKKKK